ncbi:MAG TPA: type II secretion system F family protein [Phycisphaerae bacterium]|nr:type II secretion system F family protein [Phycisphaerae bacterium]
MTFDINNIIHLTVIAATFALVLSLWLGVVLLWSIKRNAREKAVRKRVIIEEAETASTRPLKLWHQGREAVVHRPAFRRMGLAPRIKLKFQEAGWEVDLRSLTVGSIGLVLLSFFFSYATTKSLMPGLGAVILAAFVLWFLLQRRILKRTALFESQFVDALDIAARSLRAGHPLVGAFQLIATEVPPPVGALFAEICQAQEMGLSIERAIQEVGKVFSNPDVRIFGTSVAIQIKSGGNLADMMDRLAYVIRDRMRLSRRVRVLTAQTQFSKRILAVLPVIIFVVLSSVNPKYMSTMYSTDAGRFLLSIAAVGVILGIWIMNRLSVIRY